MRDSDLFESSANEMKEIKLVYVSQTDETIKPTPQEIFEEAMQEVADRNVFSLKYESKYDDHVVIIGREDFSKYASDCILVSRHFGVYILGKDDETISYIAGPMLGMSLAQPTIDFLKSIADGQWKVEGGELIPAEDVKLILEEFGEYL